jgi:hypothetical protein
MYDIMGTGITTSPSHVGYMYDHKSKRVALSHLFSFFLVLRDPTPFTLFRGHCYMNLVAHALSMNLVVFV